jgi:hypothetical protein
VARGRRSAMLSRCSPAARVPRRARPLRTSALEPGCALGRRCELSPVPPVGSRKRIGRKSHRIVRRRPLVGRGRFTGRSAGDEHSRDRGDVRARDRDTRERNHDPRDAFLEGLELPRGLEREIVIDRDRMNTRPGSLSEACLWPRFAICWAIRQFSRRNATTTRSSKLFRQLSSDWKEANSSTPGAANGVSRVFQVSVDQRFAGSADAAGKILRSN